ncbi:MAG: hypothetical protein ACKVTZ_03300 [Bacteroidia bacterium]
MIKKGLFLFLSMLYMTSLFSQPLLFCGEKKGRYTCYDDSTHQQKYVYYAGISDSTYDIYGWQWHKFWFTYAPRQGFKDTLATYQYLAKRAEGYYLLPQNYLLRSTCLKQKNNMDVIYASTPHFWFSLNNSIPNGWGIEGILTSSVFLGLPQGDYSVSNINHFSQDTTYIFDVKNEQRLIDNEPIIDQFYVSKLLGLLSFHARTKQGEITCNCLSQ